MVGDERRCVNDSHGEGSETELALGVESLGPARRFPGPSAFGVILAGGAGAGGAGSRGTMEPVSWALQCMHG